MRPWQVRRLSERRRDHWVWWESNYPHNRQPGTDQRCYSVRCACGWGTPYSPNIEAMDEAARQHRLIAAGDSEP